MPDKRPDFTRRPTADEWVHGAGDTTPAATAGPTPPAPREPTRRLTLDIPERLHR